MSRSEQLKLNGIQRAIDHADSETPRWSDRAYNFLRKYAKTNKIFMTEDVRNASSETLPEPPSKRAWGGVVLRAKKDKIIQHLRYGQVKNPLAHNANASVWISKIY